MKVELQINNSASSDARFVGWAPAPCRIRVTNPIGAISPSVKIHLQSVSAAGGGAVVFRKGTTGAFTNTLDLLVSSNGTSVPFFVAGKFGQPSVNNGDVKIEARAQLSQITLVGSLIVEIGERFTKRFRKNPRQLLGAPAGIRTPNQQIMRRFEGHQQGETKRDNPVFSESAAVKARFIWLRLTTPSRHNRASDLNDKIIEVVGKKGLNSLRSGAARSQLTHSRDRHSESQHPRYFN